jgi:hypothetical protein
VERAFGAGAAAAFVAGLVATASEDLAEARFAAFFFGAASGDFALAAFAGASLVLAVEEGEGEDLLRDGALLDDFAMWRRIGRHRQHRAEEGR